MKKETPYQIMHQHFFSPEPAEAVIHKMHTGGVGLRTLLQLRDRIKAGSSEMPPYVLWPEFLDAVNTTLKSPGMSIYGGVAGADVTPEELEVAIDELIAERTRKK